MSVLGLLVIGFLLLGGLALVAILIALVVNRKTRPIGLGVVGVLGLIGGVLLLYMVTGGVRYRSQVRQQAQAHAYPSYHRGPSQRFAQQNKSVGTSAELARAYEEVVESYADSTNVNEVDTSSDAATATEVEESAEPPAGDAAVGDETESEDSAEQPSDDADATDSETEPPETVGDDKPTTAAATPAEPKPDWVTTPPTRVGNSFQRVIRSDPYTTVEECNRHLDQLMIVATAEYLRDFLGAEEFTRYFDTDDRFSLRYRRSKPRLERIGVTSGFIRRAICKKEYVETDVHDFGEMKTVYLLMEFDADAQADLRRRWKDSQLENRLVVVGTGSSAVLLLLGTVFGFFKLDTATKGYYTKRLIFGALLVTMAVGSFVLVVVDEFIYYY